MSSPDNTAPDDEPRDTTDGKGFYWEGVRMQAPDRQWGGRSTFAEDNSTGAPRRTQPTRHPRHAARPAPTGNTDTIDIRSIAPAPQNSPAPPPAPPAPPAAAPSTVQPRAARTPPRVVFSTTYGTLTHHHAPTAPAQGGAQPRHHARRLPDDDALHIIDDLTNRPVDPLFEDAALWRKEKPAAALATKIVSFVLCVVIGILCTVSVRTLHTNTRAQIRAEEAQQLRQANQRAADLTGQIGDLQSQIDELTHNQPAAVTTPQSDQIRNGTAAISGPGITVRLTDPALPDDTTTDTSTRRRVTDTDLQLFVDRLWAMDAEGITVNGNRLSATTSIRAAGGRILIGLTPVQSPYEINAIGSPTRLARGVDSANNPRLHQSLSQLGITVDITTQDSLTMAPATLPALAWAQSS